MRSFRRPVKGTLTTIVALGLAAVAALTLGSREAHRSVTPAQLLASPPGGTVQLVGLVASPPRFRGALEFVLTDATRSVRVRVRYNGATGELRPGEQVSVTGAYRKGIFVAQPDTLVAGCANADSKEHC
jgi:cytochrome c-type biogenesis protein CcmE